MLWCHLFFNTRKESVDIAEYTRNKKISKHLNKLVIQLISSERFRIGVDAEYQLITPMTSLSCCLIKSHPYPSM